MSEQPDYLRRWPGLSVRVGDDIVEAPAEDQAVARAYPDWPEKGPIAGDKRLTIMAKQSTYRPYEEIRIIHVVDVVAPGYDVYIMGPKKVYGEIVNDQLVSEPIPDWEDPLVPEFYDGVVLPSPALDYNYDITVYTFSKPGIYRIQWQMGDLQSNILTPEVLAESTLNGRR